MAEKLPIWEQPLDTNATPDEQVAHWTAVVGHYGTTGTVGRNAVKELAAAHAAQDAASGPTGFGAGAGEAEKEAAAANAKKANPNEPSTLNLPTLGKSETPAATSKAAATNLNKATTSASTSSASKGKETASTSTASITTSPNTSGAFDPADWVNKYGAIASMAFTTPWISTLLQQAVQGKYTADKFTQAVETYQGGEPWQSIGQAVKDGEEAFYGNQSAWVQQYNDKLAILQRSAVAQGLDPSYFGSPLSATDPDAATKAYKDSSNPMNAFLNQYYNNVPDQGIIDNFVAQHATLMKNNNGGPQGAIATTANSLRNYASQYGVSNTFVNPTWTGTNSSGQSASFNQGGDYWTNAAQAISAGYTNVDSIQANLRNTAAQIYKPFATQIQNGYSLTDLAQPYMSAASNLLEVAPDSINLSATNGIGYKLSQALQGDGTNPLSLDAFTKQVKQDPAWLQTTNARNSMMDTANTLLRNFGLVTGQQ